MNRGRGGRGKGGKGREGEGGRGGHVKGNIWLINKINY